MTVYTQIVNVGSSFEQTFVYLLNDRPVNLTAWSGVLRFRDENDAVIATVRSGDTGDRSLVITAASGQIDVTMTASVTAGFTAKTGTFELEIYETANTGRVFRIVDGAVRYRPRGRAMLDNTVCVIRSTTKQVTVETQQVSSYQRVDRGPPGTQGVDGPTVLVNNTRIGAVPQLTLPHGVAITKRGTTDLRYAAPRVFVEGTDAPALNTAISDVKTSARLGSTAIELESLNQYTISGTTVDLSDTLGIHLKGTGGDGYCKITVSSGPKAGVGSSTAAVTPPTLSGDISVVTFNNCSAGMSVSAGNILQFKSAGSSAEVILVVTSYVGTTVVGEAYLSFGSGSHSDWTITRHDPAIRLDSSNASALKGFSVYVTDTTWCGACVSLQRSTGLNSDTARPHIEYIGCYGIAWGTSGVVPRWTGIHMGFTLAGQIDKVAVDNAGRAIYGAGGPMEITSLVCTNCNSPPVRIASGQGWEFHNVIFEMYNDAGSPNHGKSFGILASSVFGLCIGAGSWFGDDNGISPAGCYWIKCNGVIGLSIISPTVQMATASRAAVYIDGCTGVTVIGGYWDSPAIIEAGGSTSKGVSVLGPGYVGTYANAIQNRAAKTTGIFVGQDNTFYQWGTNSATLFSVSDYGFRTNEDGVHNIPLGGSSSIAIGACQTLPTFGGAAGSLIGGEVNSDHGFGNGIMIIPATSDADGTVNIYTYDGSAFTPQVQISPNKGLNLRRGDIRFASSIYDPTALADADATIQPTAGLVRTIAATSANRAITLGTTGAVKGMRWRIQRNDTAAFTWTFSHAATTTVFVASKLAFAEWQFDGTNWQRIALGVGS